jgi:hypothetical protein
VALLPGGESFFREMRFVRIPEFSRSQISALFGRMLGEERIGDAYADMLLRIRLQELLLVMSRVGSVSEELPEDIRRLFLGMLARDADKRPSAREVFRALRPDLAEEVLPAEKVQPDNGKAEEEPREEEKPPLRVHYCTQCGCQMTEEGEVCASCRKKQATSFFYRPTGL